jgi:hypothetical protein
LARGLAERFSAVVREMLLTATVNPKPPSRVSQKRTDMSNGSGRLTFAIRGSVGAAQRSEAKLRRQAVPCIAVLGRNLT